VTLKEQLDAYQAKARAKRPPEVQAIMDRETDNLRRSGIADRALRAGATAPQRFDHRHDAAQLLRGGHGLGTRARRLPAHVHPVGPVLEQAQAVSDGGVLARGDAAGERVGRDVEDAHDERALAQHHGDAPKRDAVKAAPRAQGRTPPRRP